MENCAEKMTGFVEANRASDDRIIVRSGPRRKNSLWMLKTNETSIDIPIIRSIRCRRSTEEGIPRGISSYVAAISACFVVRLVGII